ncbi:two-component sensor histidine kinase [Floricoccus penangensis]|uniref:histidine kinase n=1 Tax=Floricoccus penangensis TaxID=1859475 RepID=A0A9Q5P0H9_9LACT|nr:HAMP domain-containing sensor histidine kinase [Floricoccus penangensis]OFI47789.1 two-component sensor histidine kinase [Floricoccus penangensis]
MKKIDFRSFLHFFIAFTVIFVLLTVIILQVLSSGLYKSTDENIQKLASNPQKLASIALTGSNDGVFNDTNNGIHSFNNEESGDYLKSAGDFGPNETIIVYDAKGNILNPSKIDISDNLILKSIKFDNSSLNSIKSVTVTNPYGRDMQFRTEIIEPKFNPSITNIAYIQILVNTNQLSESLSRSRVIIISVMVVFWFVSLGVSIYLSQWSNRVLYKAYEKQKSFVENASHELRTPLAILQNRLELLFQHPNASIIDESENISESLNEVRNMRILTSNLLNLAKRDEGLKIKLTNVDKSFFETIFENYQMLAENRGKKFTSSVELNDNKIKIDESLIKQVLTILFDNAIKYTGEDGEIHIDIREKNGNLVMKVFDNGEGISPDDREKIFDRFYRVDKARTRAKGGFGLGLSLAKQIVEHLHGKIQVSSNLPKGSIFTVRLKV